MPISIEPPATVTPGIPEQLTAGAALIHQAGVVGDLADITGRIELREIKRGHGGSFALPSRGGALLIRAREATNSTWRPATQSAARPTAIGHCAWLPACSPRVSPIPGPRSRSVLLRQGPLRTAAIGHGVIHGHRSAEDGPRGGHHWRLHHEPRADAQPSAHHAARERRVQGALRRIVISLPR